MLFCLIRPTRLSVLVGFLADTAMAFTQDQTDKHQFWSGYRNWRDGVCVSVLVLGLWWSSGDLDYHYWSWSSFLLTLTSWLWRALFDDTWWTSFTLFHPVGLIPSEVSVSFLIDIVLDLVVVPVWTVPVLFWIFAWKGRNYVPSHPVAKHILMGHM